MRPCASEARSRAISADSGLWRPEKGDVHVEIVGISRWRRRDRLVSRSRYHLGPHAWGVVVRVDINPRNIPDSRD